MQARDQQGDPAGAGPAGDTGADRASARAAASARLPELDGLRALAVIGVVLFHFLQRFSHDYPYGAQLLPAARYGWLGVDLFFIISGFVIALTLQSTPSALDFVVRRAARLVPAMLVCSLITFAALHVLDTPFARAHRVGIAGFVPSLTFTDPALWQWLLPGVDYIDGAFWSLFVEVRFYFWAALVWFLFGGTRFLPLFLAGSLLAVAGYALMPDGHLKYAALILFFPQYLPLFCTGMLLHALFGGARGWAVSLALLLFTTLSILSVKVDGLVPMALIGLFVLLFLALIWRRDWLAPFTMPGLTLIGASSYSLYLVHQYLGVTLIAMLPRGHGMLFYAAGVLAVFAMLLAVAVLVYRTVERPAQAMARRWLAQARTGEVGGSGDAGMAA